MGFCSSCRVITKLAVVVSVELQKPYCLLERVSLVGKGRKALVYNFLLRISIIKTDL